MFYERFLPDRADKLKPLYELSKSSKFVWTEECDKAFGWLKSQVTSDRVLALYDPNLPLVLACDASNVGLSAILSHRYPDNTERPIAFASKIIPKQELHRAILDKEAAAIVFGFRKFYQYVYGAKVFLKTDHEPLKFIFGNNKNLSVMIQTRLLRWACFLAGFTYEIEVVKSKANGNADALSRLPIEDNTPVFETDFTSVNYVQSEFMTIDVKCVARETAKDSSLRKIVSFLQQGWPRDSKQLSDSEINLYKKRLDLSFETGCIFWGFRIVIPKSIQKEILSELHASHMGATKMKQLARSYFWWPYLNDDIEQMIGTCRNCLESRVETPKVPLTPWYWPDKPWSRVHTDFLGPFHGNMFLLVLDANSKWPEIFNMKQNTKAEKLILKFKEIFSRFGLSEMLVCDNGPQYRSDIFRTFLRRNGVRQTFSPPHYPATNGAAENFVKTFKSSVDKIVKDGKSLEDAVSLFLFDYRSTPHMTTGESPAKLMFNRELRTRFDLLKPNVRSVVENKQFLQAKNVQGRRKCTLEVGERVFANDPRKATKRSEAVIVRRNSPNTYDVKFDDDYVSKKHANQIVKTRLGDSFKKGESADASAKCNGSDKSASVGFVPRRSDRLKGK